MELPHRHCRAGLVGHGLTMAETICADVAFGIAGFVAYLAVIALVLRSPWGSSPARAAIGIALLAYAAVVAAAALFGRNANFWTVSIVFWFATLLFLMAFGALYKSISLRILLDLLDRPGQAGLYSAILARYVAAESFESRLRVMKENGFAVATPGGYALTDKGRRLARLVGALHRLFAIERSG
jgi:hypothetical protein